ncbi:SEFIR domain-containing protein [Streptomyces sp. NPDC001651]|uniref:VMAP-C domain-containing protein n=1 Tax=Streptomyces sp. NPDC001651 TaxID=3364596 RepID=UPI0036BFF64C
MGIEGDTASERARPRIFISYAHDDPAHIRQVETLYELLRVKGGLDARLDSYAGVQSQDWPWWMHQQYTDADFVLVIASPEYKVRGERPEPLDGVGLGVFWETRRMMTEMYDDYQRWLRRILLVVLPGRSEKEFPAFMGAERISRFQVPTLDETGIESLVRRITGQPERVEPPMGPIPVYPPQSSLLSAPSPGPAGAPEVRDVAEGADEGAHGLDAQAWRLLADILQGVAPPRWAEQAYQWSFGETGSLGWTAAPPVPVGDVDLYAWARDLGERRHPPGTVPKAIIFVQALAAGFAAGENPAERRRARELNAWVTRFLSDGELPALPAVPRIERTEATLTVRLAEHPQRQGSFHAEIWRRTTDGRRPERLRPEPSSAPIVVDVEGARRLLEDCLRPGTLGPGVRLQRVEFAVSDGLLEEGFDQWEVRLRRDSRALGKVYEVVVRCLDRRWGADLAERWSSRWRWLTRQRDRNGLATVWVGDEHAGQLDDLVGEWYETDHPVCVAVSMAQARPGVDAALDAGMPVVVWQRACDREDPTVPLLSKLVDVSDVSRLPLDVKALRRDRDVPDRARASVVLLWDDPDHPVGVEPLSDANLIA